MTYKEFTEFINRELSLHCSVPFNCSSPFRRDNNASISFFIARDKETIMCYDLGTNTLLDPLSTIQAIVKKNLSHTIEKRSGRGLLFTTVKDFDIKGLEYWSGYGITTTVLEQYNVRQVDKYGLGGTTQSIVKPELSFMYVPVIGNGYKIYSPGSDNKWLSTTTDFTVYGNKSNAPFVIITSSVKDSMALGDLKEEAQVISFNSEIPMIPEWFAKSLPNKGVIIYDSDTHGLSASEKLSAQLGYVNLSSILTSKDISDQRKETGSIDNVLQQIRKIM